jgi:hypothetical protein
VMLAPVRAAAGLGAGNEDANLAERRKAGAVRYLYAGLFRVGACLRGVTRQIRKSGNRFIEEIVRKQSSETHDPNRSNRIPRLVIALSRESVSCSCMGMTL